MCVETYDSRLIGLCYVGEDDIYHAHEHSVAEWMAGVFDNGNDVGAMCGHGDEITAAAMGEFDGIDAACGPDDVGDV
jgi:hypothetical protein